MKRLPNGYGGVTKLSGNRSKPYMAWIPQKQIIAGKVLDKYHKDVRELSNWIDERQFDNEEFEKDLRALVLKHSKDELEIKRKKSIIGYYSTRQEALNALAKRNSLPIDGELTSLTFSDIWTIISPQIYEGVVKATKLGYITAYKYCVSLYNKKITTIKTVDMQRCLDEVSLTAPSTQSKIISICRAVFNYAMEQDIVTKNYAEYLHKNHWETEERQAFTNEEIQTILNNREWRYKTQRNTSMTGFDMPRLLIILLYTGMRISEALNVRADQVHIEERYIEVEGTKTANAKRIVPIHKDILYLMECKGDYLFTRNDGKQVGYNSVKDTIWVQYKNDLNIEHTIHETRHTFITMAQASHLDGLALRQIAGHSGKDVTENVYTHPIIENLISEIDKFKLIF